MKKRIISLILVIILAVSLVACSSEKGAISQEKAQKIALEHAGLTESQVEDVHVHVSSENGIPCYSIHITTAEGDFSILVNAANGEILG